MRTLPPLFCDMKYKQYPLYVVDIESYYDNRLSLKRDKMGISEYVTDPEFKTFGISIRNHATGITEWITDNFAERLAEYNLDQCAVISHNALFDMFVLAYHYAIYPAYYIDTLVMSRGIYPYEDHDLDTQALLHGGKGKTNKAALDELAGVREPSAEQLHALGIYANQDTEDASTLFEHYISCGFPDSELDLIDITTRMFTAPKLHLDPNLAREELGRLYAEQEQLIQRTGYTKKALNSRNEFAAILRKHGVEPPTVINEKGKTAFSFNKNNPDFQKLLSHDNPTVRNIINARLALSGNIHISRLERLLAMWERAKIVPVGLKVYGAKTLRWSGTDKTNMQNIPKTRMRECLIAPPGYKVVVGDSSQIEARVNAWNSDEEGLLQTFANKGDPYCDFASLIYGRPISKADVLERFVGKTCILGLGYGMGAARLQFTLATQAAKFGILDYVPISDALAYQTVQTYRYTYQRIKAFWDMCQTMIGFVMPNVKSSSDFFDNAYNPPAHTHKAITFDKECIRLPNGMALQYPGIRPDGTYYGNRHIYGAHMVENIIQCLARLVVAEQMTNIAKYYQPVMMTHDEIVLVVPDEEVECAIEVMNHYMRVAPAWCSDIPLDCEVKFDDYYCK